MVKRVSRGASKALPKTRPVKKTVPVATTRGAQKRRGGDADNRTQQELKSTVASPSILGIGNGGLSLHDRLVDSARTEIIVTTENLNAVWSLSTERLRREALQALDRVGRLDAMVERHRAEISDLIRRFFPSHAHLFQPQIVIEGADDVIELLPSLAAREVSTPVIRRSQRLMPNPAPAASAAVGATIITVEEAGSRLQRLVNECEQLSQEKVTHANNAARALRGVYLRVHKYRLCCC